MSKPKLIAVFALAGILPGCSGKPDLTCAIIHEPATGCPTGYLREKTARFTEKDGTKQFACVAHDPAKERCTDVLNPGESESIMLFKQPETEPAKTEPGKS